MGYDYRGEKKYCCGVNTGVIFIRVHEWSLNFLMRAMTYPYYNIENEIKTSDQTSINNLLIEADELEHYVVLPQRFFNTRIYKEGEFLYHIMGTKGGGKEKLFREFLNVDFHTLNNKTNAELRKEVVDYFNLPEEKKLHIKVQP